MKVLDMFDDNLWLGSSGSGGDEWPVAYYAAGTDAAGHAMSHAGYSEADAALPFRKGYYFTGDIEVAERYATTCVVGDRECKLVFHCRVNPRYLQKLNKGRYFVVPTERDVRPYGYLLKTVKLEK
jgi:hypothetical protein